MTPVQQIVQETDWKYVAAKAVRRFGRFLHDTDPGPSFVFFITLVMVGMFSVMGDAMTEHALSVPRIAWHCVTRVIGIEILVFAVFYGGYEAYNGMLRLKRWSDEYHETIRRKNQDADPNYRY